jgi:molybdopterin molybdotransferase
MKRVITDEELRHALLPYDDAVRLVASSFAPLPGEAFALDEALDLVAAEHVVSPVDVPGFASSAMDGYAVRSVDVADATPRSPVVLSVTRDVPAGAADARPLERGAAAPIMTGGPVPDGADCVVPWEDTDRGTERVAIYASAEPGRNVRPRGEDLRIGDVVATHGDVLDPVRLGMLASVGRTSVRAHRRPRVAVLSTGDELVAPGGEPASGRVFDANSTLISALVRRAGATPTRLAMLPDDPNAIAE